MARTARRILIGAVLVVLAVIALAWVLDVSIVRLREGARGIEHTRAVVMGVERTLSDLKDAETGQRGYLLTGDATYLEPYEAAAADLPGRLAELERLTAGQAQRGRVEELSRLARERLAIIAETIRLAQAGEREAALRIIQEGGGKRLMDQLRTIAARVGEDERAELHRRVEEGTLTVRRVRQIALTG